MKHLFLITASIIFLISCSNSSQKQPENTNNAKTDSLTTKNNVIQSVPTTNKVSQETIEKEESNSLEEQKTEVHPFRLGNSSKLFSSSQIDFSKDYLLAMENIANKYETLVTDELEGYKFIADSIFTHHGNQSNGVIGQNYQRIRVHIHYAQQTSDKVFEIRGKTNVKENICDFSGDLEIINVYEQKENFDIPGQGTMFCTYELFEDSTQNHVGVFRGTFECSIRINHVAKTIKLDDAYIANDGYYNRNYVGTWTQFGSNKSKKCIWGDYRLPFTFDFDNGDGEMAVNEKYKANGWGTFGDMSEYDEALQLKDKWWFRK